jgi:hypothetical protein
VLRLLSIGPTRMSDDARRVAAGGAAQVAVMRASSEDRKAAGAGSGSGSPPAAAYRIQLKSADMKEEMRQEAVDIARVVRAASLLYSIRIISRCALPLSLVLTAGLLSVFFFPLGDFFSGCRRSRSTPWRRTSPSTSRRSSTRTTARPGTASSAATLVMLSSHFLETLLCTEAGGVTIVLIVVGL